MTRMFQGIEGTDKRIIGIRFTFQSPSECLPNNSIKITIKNVHTERCKWFRITTSETVREAFILNKFLVNEQEQFLGPLPCWYFLTANDSEFTNTPIMPNDKMTFEVTNISNVKMEFVGILTCWTYSTE